MARSNGIDGVINLHKPIGISSARALYRIRGITGQRKSGHGGTLDPMASGVLILCLGKATKLVERLMDQPKVYRATARLDVTSDSLDTETPFKPVKCTSRPSKEDLLRACGRFEGVVQQVPPLTSAIKVEGQPAYKRARASVPLALEPRAVRIHWLYLHALEWPTLDIEICCGRGTYVRSLVRDLGQVLGTGGCLTSLVRRRVGPFTLEDAWTQSDIERRRDSLECLIEPARVWAMLKAGEGLIPSRPRS